MDEQLRQWGTKLDELVAQAEAAGEDAKSDGRKHIATLRSRHQAARAKLDELEAAGSEKWEILKDGIESAWGELETAFEKLKN
jgi:hypothetical protein